MDNRFVLTGIAGLVGLMLIIILISGVFGSDEVSDAMNRRLDAVTAEVQGVGGVAEGLSGGITSLEERLTALETATTEQGAALLSVADQLGILDQTLQTRAEEEQAQAAAAMETLLASLAATTAQADGSGASDAAEGDGTGGEAEGGGADTTAAASVQSAPVPAIDREILPEMLHQTGKTARAGDGAFRAYVSRVDPEAQIVSLYVNGVATSLTLGQSVTDEIEDQLCRATLLGFEDKSAALDVTCAPVSEGGSDGEKPEGGIRPGSVAILGDGAVRAFVSSVAGDGSGARIALNGVLTQQVAAGEAVELEVDGETCTVTVAAISGGQVAFGYGCGS